MDIRDEEMTSEQFDAAFEAAEPVHVVGSPKVRLIKSRTIPGGFISRSTRLSIGAVVVHVPAFGADYAAKVSGTAVASRGVPTNA